MIVSNLIVRFIHSEILEKERIVWEKMKELVPVYRGKDVSALNPYIGYYKAAAIAQKAHREGITLRQAAIGSGEVTAEEFDRWGDPARMVGES